MYFNSDIPKTRVNGTTKSAIPFGVPPNEQQYDFNSQGVRQRQF